MALQNFLTEVVFLFDQGWVDLDAARKAPPTPRGLTGSRCLAQRGLLLASVYVLQRIPSHPLHVSALLRWPPSSVGTAGGQNRDGRRGT